MSDYTLPPVPHNPHTALERDWTQTERKAISAYGHACRAPLVEENARLLARVAELEALVELYRKQGSEQDNRAWIAMSAECEARGEAIDRLRAEVERLNARLEVNPDAPDCDGIYCRDTTIRMLEGDLREVRAEVEKLRAESVIEWEPGRSYTAGELLRRAIRGIRGRKSRSICPAVEKLFGCGNTVARHLCRWAGRDPDTGKAIAARKGEGSES